MLIWYTCIKFIHLFVCRSFPNHFDENALFAGSLQGIRFKYEFKEKFRNISRIMDCVGCDKCKLWGKLQVSEEQNGVSISLAGENFLLYEI